MYPYPHQQTGFGLAFAGRRSAGRRAARRIRLNLPSTYVQLFHAWRP